MCVPSSGTMQTKVVLSFKELKIAPEVLTDQQGSDPSAITELCLNNNSLIVPPNELLSKLDNLQLLSLENNNLTFIPHDIVHLARLRFLNISSNPLTYLPPDTISNLLNLKELWLNNCGLSEFPDQVTHLVNLTTLSLSNNSIPTIPDTICSLVNLRWLSLGHNQLTTISKGITELTQLRVLLTHCNLVVEFPDEVVFGTTGSQLAVLSLRNNNIPLLPREWALKLISACNKLVKLDLRDNPIITQDDDELPWKELDFVFI